MAFLRFRLSFLKIQKNRGSGSQNTCQKNVIFCAKKMTFSIFEHQRLFFWQIFFKKSFKKHEKKCSVFWKKREKIKAVFRYFVSYARKEKKHQKKGVQKRPWVLEKFRKQGVKKRQKKWKMRVIYSTLKIFHFFWKKRLFSVSFLSKRVIFGRFLTGLFTKLHSFL